MTWPRPASQRYLPSSSLSLHRLAAQILLDDVDQGFLSTFLLQDSQGPATRQTKKNSIILHPAFPERAASSGWDRQVLTATEKCLAEGQGRKPGNHGGAPRGMVLPPRSAGSSLSPQGSQPSGGRDHRQPPPTGLGAVDSLTAPGTGSHFSETYHLPVFCSPDKPGVSASVGNV